MPETPAGPAWLVEEGVGEHRAVRLGGGRIVAARVEWPGRLAAGEVADAVLVSRGAGSSRGTLRFASGEEALIDGLPPGASEGRPVRALVTRAAIAETGRTKRAQARLSDAPARPAPSLAERLAAEGGARVVRRFADADWDELFAQAWSGTAEFDGGALTISPTPAMTLIDVDGSGAATAIALAAVPALAEAIFRLDIAGSIGIDFPTLSDRGDRRRVDTALADALARWPHQATAMNGFGFVQLVARLEQASFLQRVAGDRAGAAARALLRRAEHVAAPGALLVAAHPAVIAAIVPAWRAELARRTGRELRFAANPALALEGGFAQAVER